MLVEIATCGSSCCCGSQSTSHCCTQQCQETNCCSHLQCSCSQQCGGTQCGQIPSSSSCCCNNQTTSHCCTQQCKETNCCPQQQCSCSQQCGGTGCGQVPVINIPGTPGGHTNVDVDNSQTLNNTVNISMANLINNRNVIDNPINVHNRNINNVVVKGNRSNCAPQGGRDVELIPYRNDKPVPTESGCCNAVSPCQSGICRRRTCGRQCRGRRQVFVPENPCGMLECTRRRSVWIRRTCNIQVTPYSAPSCRNVMTDCSMCGANFYMNYNIYMNCYGCFY